MKTQAVYPSKIPYVSQVSGSATRRLRRLRRRVRRLRRLRRRVRRLSISGGGGSAAAAAVFLFFLSPSVAASPYVSILFFSVSLFCLAFVRVRALLPFSLKKKES